MAAPSRVYLRTLSSSNRKLAKLGERIAGGGAGNIYRLPGRAGEVLKIYKTEKDRGLYAPKLEAMLACKPALSNDNPKFRQLAWPTSIAEAKDGQFLGFSMPEIDFDGSVSLERMLQKRMRQVTGLPEFYGYRVTATYNLALSVAALHKRGHHVIDLKPANCRLHAEEMMISILDCDGFSVDGGAAGRYPAHQFTPEYIAPEAFGEDPHNLGEAQDLFALAVIIFRLLNNGIHPFQARLGKGLKSGTLQDMINAGYYAYGLKSSPKYKPAGQSVHAYFPDDIRGLFDRAFKSSARPSAESWRDALRNYADPSSGKLSRCDKHPEEHGHFGKGCGWCKLDEINLSPMPAKGRTKRQANRGGGAASARQATAAPMPAGIIPSVSLGSLSIMRNRWALIFTIVAAIVLIGVSGVSPDGAPPPPHSQQLQKRQQPSPPVTKKSPPPNPLAHQFTTINKQGFMVANTNLRAGPGTGFAVISRLPPGTEVSVRAKIRRKNWFLVELAGRSGAARTKVRGFVHGKGLAVFR